MAEEFLGEGDDINGAIVLREIGNALVDAAMRVQEEMIGLEGGESFVLQVVVEQNCAEDGTLRLWTGRKTAIETEISSRHRYKSFQRTSALRLEHAFPMVVCESVGRKAAKLWKARKTWLKPM